MQTRMRSTAQAIAFVAVAFGVTTAGSAQTPAPKMSRSGTSGMMGGPHHVLAMAYHDNLVTFARALHGVVAHAKTVDMDVAKPAVAEIRRSYDQMVEHHKAQAGMMGEHPSKSMAAMMKSMDTHVAELGKHVTELEAEVNSATPSAAKVADHTAEILKHAGMLTAAMPKGMAH